MIRRIALFASSAVLLVYAVIVSAVPYYQCTRNAHQIRQISSEITEVSALCSAKLEESLIAHNGFELRDCDELTDELLEIIGRATTWRNHSERLKLAQKFLDENYSSSFVQVFMSDATEETAPEGIRVSGASVIPIGKDSYAGVVYLIDGTSFGTTCVVLFDIGAEGGVTNLRAYDELA